MSEKVRGGWEGETAMRVFDSTETFDQILALITRAQSGSLKDSRGKEVDAGPVRLVKSFFENRVIVTVELLNQITRQYGLREAVVRAMRPDFSKVVDPNYLNFDYVISWLEHFQAQELACKNMEAENGSQIFFMSDSSGNVLNYAQTIQTLSQMKEFLSKSDSDPFLVLRFAQQITGNHGLREFVLRILDSYQKNRSA